MTYVISIIKDIVKNEYYVYVYLDPRKPGKYIYGEYEFEYEPFYIGKGKGDRMFKHLTETEKTSENIFKYRVISNIKLGGLEPIIKKIVSGLKENDAYNLESEIIGVIGRRTIGSGTLTNICEDNKPPKNYKALPKDKVNKIIELYNDGWYLKHIADELDLKELKIKSVLLENNITPKRKPPTNKILLTEDIISSIIFDYNNGLSIRKICDRYNFSYEVIRKNLKKNGIKFRGYDYKKTYEHINKIVKKRKELNLVGDKSASYIILSDSVKEYISKYRLIDKYSIHTIGNKLGLSYQKVYTTLIELNISTKRIR